MCAAADGIQLGCGIIIRIAEINRAADVNSKHPCKPPLIAIGKSQPEQILVLDFGIHIETNGQSGCT